MHLNLELSSPAEGTYLNCSRAPTLPQVEKSEPGNTASLIDVDSPHVSSVPPDYADQRVKTTTQAERLEREAELAKQKASEQARNAKDKAQGTGDSLRRNKDNPVVLGNAFLITAVSAALGFAAYQKHAEGKLSWQLLSLWSGAVGALATVDYFVSK